MADRALIDRLEAGGLSRDDATAQADRVFAAVVAELGAGRSVGIPGVGRLNAPLKAVWVPGSLKKRARQERKVSLRYPSIIERGEEYAL